jgi:hypothetical protein
MQKSMSRWMMGPGGKSLARLALLFSNQWRCFAFPFMQTAAKRQAAAGGVTPVGLGYGFPLSLPKRQYEALKPDMKWY